MSAVKKISLALLVILYLAGGINHFWHPDGYIKIIPQWLPYPAALNYAAGICEVVFAIMLLFPSTRAIAGWLIVMMLAAFLAVHIDMVLYAPMLVGKLTVTPLIAWARLLLQPVLMLWAWWHTKRTSTT